MESKIFALVAFFFLLPACVASGAQSEEVVVTKADNGKQITVDKGATIRVQLQQSSGTGYLWQLVNLDETHLKVLGPAAHIALKQGRIGGGPMLRSWDIEAVSRGQTELNALLYRSWEGTKSAVEKVHVRIFIK